jgi:hypothetical protein
MTNHAQTPHHSSQMFEKDNSSLIIYDSVEDLDKDSLVDKIMN